MRRITPIALLALLAGSALAQTDPTSPKFTSEPVTTQAAQEAVPEAAGPMTEIQLERRRAMNEEVAARIAAEQETVAALVAKLETATTSEARLALQGEITLAKQKGWRDLLAIQLKYAEIGGHAEQAADLRLRVTRLDEGLSPQQPARPAHLREDVAGDKGGR